VRETKAIAMLWASGTPVQNTEETLVHDAAPAPATTKVGDIVAGDYRTAAVFEKHGIDFCCGGSVTLAAACAEKAIDPAALARELEDVRAHLPAPAGVRGRPAQARPPREQHPVPARD